MNKRRFIVLSGEKDQRFSVVQSLIKSLPIQSILWFTRPPFPIDSLTLTGTITHSIDQVLGREYKVVIFDAFSGFNPDALAALAGTIKAGGVLILLSPPLADWHQFDDPFTQRITSWPYSSADVSGRFIRHFVRHLKQATFIEKVTFAEVRRIPTFVSKPSQLSLKLNQNSNPNPILNSRPNLTPNNEQKRVIATIKRVALCETSAVLVVEADRGRGKSAALGMAAAELMALSQNPFSILVIAPTLKTVDVLFHYARQEKDGTLFFMAPDAALQTLPVADLVLIDEAAAIPSALLMAYVKHYSHLVFATTVHGYEGTGRGFALRFRHVLDQYCPNWQTEHLQQAIRYQAYDPLERFIFRSLLLEVAPSKVELASKSANFSLDSCVVKRINRDALLADSALLEALFGLLVLAHYQTRPTDLRHLLDGKHVVIYAVFWQKKVIATCLMVKEGGFDAELAHAIYYGKRRPQGHLVPQSLAFHAGLPDVPLLITERVMRIVVHPRLQQRGIASWLLAHIEQKIRLKNSRNNPVDKPVDYLSTSFAATETMVAFWHKQGFTAVHMGLRRDASSGCHSLMMIKPLTLKGDELLSMAQQQFYLHFPVLLEEALQDVEQVLIATLLPLQDSEGESVGTGSFDDGELSALDHADLHSFADGHRGYAFCLYAIRKFLRLPKVERLLLLTLSVPQQQLVQLRVIDRLSIHEVRETLRFNGKKVVDKQLRGVIHCLLDAYLSRYEADNS